MGVKLVASSGGSVELVTANTASNFTVTVPASTTTMVGTDATQTLTSKTLTSPTLTTPVVTTTIGVGNATPANTGAGISFPATQSASSDANTLDDYEEGTFTPTFVNLTVVGSPTYAGFYTKIGRLVYVQISITGGTSTASIANSTYVSNLPFSVIGVAVGTATNATVANYGVGYIGGASFYPPSWSATGTAIYLSGVYYTT